MGLEGDDADRVVPATFGATDDSDIFEDVHFAQRQRRGMGFKAAREAGLRGWPRRGVR